MLGKVRALQIADTLFEKGFFSTTYNSANSLPNKYVSNHVYTSSKQRYIEEKVKPKSSV